MSTYTKRRHNPQGQRSTAGKRHSNVDRVDQPFPNKPVSHRRPVNPRKQCSPDLYDFEKISITKQPKGLQEHHSNDTKEARGSRQHPRRDSHRMPSGELQMARAIRAKELMLLEKLCSVEEKIREKKQREQKSEERRHDRGRAERSREMMRQERSQEDERSRWKRRDKEDAQTQRKDHHQMRVHEDKRSGELNKSRWENVKEHTRRRGNDGKDNGVCGEDGRVKTKEREQNTTTVGDKGQTTENKYRERSQKEVYEQDRAAGGKLSGGAPGSPPLPPSRPEQEEGDGKYSADLQLFPCTICNRKFRSDRLQMHVKICKNLKQRRPVFNSYANRTKGSDVEEFWKTHSRPKSPEVLKKKNQKTNARNLHKGRPPAGTSQPKWSK